MGDATTKLGNKENKSYLMPTKMGSSQRHQSIY